MEIQLTYEMIVELDQLEEIVTLQKLVWGDEVVTSLPQMVAAIHNGGVVIGAKESGGNNIVGFCYGFAGIDKNERKPHLCSHMMAIHPNYQNQGIGRKLKLKQREWAIDFGYEKITWTFDPLEVRNGYLNLCKLGGYVRKYIPDYYGLMGDKLNKGLSSDRFLLEWDLYSARSEQAAGGESISSEEWSGYSQFVDWKVVDSLPRPRYAVSLKGEQGYLLAVPKSIQLMKQIEMELVKEWRFISKEMASQAFLNGYYLVGVLRSEDPVHYYVFEKKVKERKKE